MKYTVIGLGQFGRNLCLELAALKMDVVAVGNTEECLEDVQDQVTYAIISDYTNPNSLKEMEFDDDSVAIVYIGDSFEENLLVVSYLQQMGVKQIYARALSDVHEHILKQMNAKFINLAQVTARQFASQLQSPQFLSATPLDESHAIVEMAVPENWIGRKLRDVELRTRFKLNLLTIRRGDVPEDREGVMAMPRNPVIGTPDPDLEFKPDDILILFGREDSLTRFAEYITEEQEK